MNNSYSAALLLLIFLIQLNLLLSMPSTTSTMTSMNISDPELLFHNNETTINTSRSTSKPPSIPIVIIPNISIRNRIEESSERNENPSSTDYDYDYYEDDSSAEGIENSEDYKNKFFVKISTTSTEKPPISFTTKAQLDQIVLDNEIQSSPKAVIVMNETITTADSTTAVDSEEIDNFLTSSSSNYGDDDETDSKSATSIPGIAGEDYPIFAEIIPTSFECGKQRYKGFFADLETRCQTWHFCDFQDNQQTFLCPNGTIFSQLQLTCDWWFNVNCFESQQLYVLNERLYRYVKAPQPMFPEDYHGPEVDLWLIQQYKQGLLPKQKQVIVNKTVVQGNH